MDKSEMTALLEHVADGSVSPEEARQPFCPITDSLEVSAEESNFM